MLNQELKKYGLSVNKGFEPQPPFKFERNVALGNCEIFSGCSFGFGSYINSGTIREGVIIGRYCSIGRNVTIGSPNHDYNALSTSPFFLNNSHVAINKYADNETKTSVLIGNDVWIGDKVFIKSGIKIGDGAVIGAGSVVTKDIEPYSISFGVPAKFFKYRFSTDIISKLLNLRWFEFDPLKLKDLDVKNINFCINKMERWPETYRTMKEKVYTICS
jgi:acetyltransferase-like isoleucine patch superfamily enzyme